MIHDGSQREQEKEQAFPETDKKTKFRSGAVDIIESCSKLECSEMLEVLAGFH